MIYTTTLNPSLDYIVTVDDFQTGGINRTETELILPGGKGLNVSMVLKNLGYDSVALGFLAGFTGQEIEKRLNDFGCRSDFIYVEDGLSRINVKLKSQNETEINGAGPTITTEIRDRLFTQLEQLVGGDILVLSGSIPTSMADDTYESIMARLSDKDVEIIVDATGKLLTKVLKYKPFLIKPNNHELGDIFGVTLKSDEEIIHYARKLQEMGARNVLISMAGDGALFIGEDGTVERQPAPQGKLINSVGAGDSMVAGFLAGYLGTGDLRRAFHTGIAAGSASAFSEYLATKPEVEALLAGIEN